MKVRNLAKWISTGVIISFIIGEISVRVAGMVDFPTYEVDDEIGYIPKPNQQGCFLNKNCWGFNDRSMGTSAPWIPEHHRNVLLIGNSIVMGGNPYDQPDKLGPLIQEKVGPVYSIWPIAAGGWSNVNETVYMERHPEVLQQAEFFVWEFMAGGVSERTRWAGEYVWPREHPKCALWYVFRRYALPRIIHFNMNELPPEGAPNAVNLARFEATLANLSKATGRVQPGILFLYPRREQLQMAHDGLEWLPERQVLERLSEKYGLKLVDMSTYPAWTAEMYREGTHPTVAGNRVLADILSAAILNSVGQ